MPRNDRDEVFEHALMAGLSRPEIMLAAEDAPVPLEDLGRELRDDERNLWAAVDDEVKAVERLEETLARHRAEVAATEGEESMLENALLVLGGLGVLAGLAYPVVGLVLYLVTDAFGTAVSIFFAPLPAAAGSAFGVGLVMIFVQDTIERRRKRPAAAMAGEGEALEERIAAASDVLATALLEQAVLPRLRELIDRRLQDSYALRLAVDSSIGLAEPFHPRFEVATPARRELEGILASRSGANVGLAGPRGVGKTTLISSVTRTDQDEWVCVRAAAPVQYEPREFLLHLFALLCEGVLEREGVHRGSVPAMQSVPERSLLSRVRRAAGAVAKAVGLLAAGGAAGDASAASDREWLPLSLNAQQALELLDQIRFQQTHTQGWSGTLQTPGAIVSAQLQTGRSYAREPMTFPDVVAGFRTFAAQLGTSAKVIVGIDELDKMEDEARAERFLNDIKAIFDVRNCFYLLAVSEDALSRFERRGVPVRDAFDSSLDEIVLVTPLDLRGAMALVRRRVIGMPVPFVALAHSVSGGIPRELLRIVRRMVAIAEESDEPPKLAAVAQRLLRDDLVRKVTTMTARVHDSDAARRAAALFTWASELKAAEDVARLRMLVGSIAKEADGEAGLRTYAYLVLTLLDFFDDRLDEASLRDAMAATDAGGLERLAEARQAFAFGPEAPWGVLTAFRDARMLPSPWGVPA